MSFKHKGLQIRARSIDGCGVAGTAGPKDYDVSHDWNAAGRFGPNVMLTDEAKRSGSTLANDLMHLVRKRCGLLNG